MGGSGGGTQSDADKFVGQLIDEGSHALAGEHAGDHERAVSDAYDQLPRDVQDDLGVAVRKVDGLQHPGGAEPRLGRVQQRRLLPIAAIAVLLLVVLVVAVFALNGGSSPANVPAGQAQQPAGNAGGAAQPADAAPGAAQGAAGANDNGAAGNGQQGAAQPGGAGAVQPGGNQGAGGQQQGGGSAGGAVPADCLVPGDKVTITLENSEWTETSDQVIGGYEIFLANGTDKQICVLEHFTSQNSRNDPANRPPNGWTSDCNWFAASGESQGQDHHPLAGAEFWRGEYATECYFDYPDKIVAVYYDKCPAILKAKLDGMPTDQRGTILDPYAWDLPVLGRAQGFKCQ